MADNANKDRKGSGTREKNTQKQKPGEKKDEQRDREGSKNEPNRPRGS